MSSSAIGNDPDGRIEIHWRLTTDHFVTVGLSGIEWCGESVQFVVVVVHAKYRPTITKGPSED